MLTSEDSRGDHLFVERATAPERSRRLLRLQALDCVALDSELRDQLQRLGQTLYAGGGVAGESRAAVGVMTAVTRSRTAAAVGPQQGRAAFPR